jgi:radical SAM-linked protein
MRGCPQGCRFCMASPIYKPVRVRPAAEVIAQIEKQLATTGYGEVTLLSLSSSDYPNIESLASTLARRLEPQRVSLSLPSLRPGSITAGTLNALSRVRVASLTIAPEAGTERLRLFIRKDFPDEAIVDTVRLAFDNGINSIKLYFMIGLPTETEDELLGIVDLCQRIHQVAASFSGRRSLTITLSPFVPKPHTPFQWDAALSDSDQFERIQFVRRKLRLSNTTVRHNSTRLAQLVAAVGRGDRSMAEAVRIAHSKGCRFDGWTEHFDWDRWQEAFAEAGISLPEELAARSFEQELPWSHIEKGQSVAKLRQERQRTSLKMRDYVSPEPANTIQSAEPTVQFGRSKKRSAGRAAAVAPTKNKVRLKWGRSDRFRYMSHLDTLRLLERTLRRSRLPVAYSQGFNPTMKLSFGPPLSVGFTSECELLEIVLDQNWSPSMLEQLRRCVPEGLDLHEARVVHLKTPSLASVLNRASYSVDLSDWDDMDSLNEQISEVLRSDTLETERTTKDKTKTVDIRPALYRLDIEADRLTMLLGVGEGGYARPDEIIRLLDAGLAVPPKAVAVHRTGLFRSDEADALIEGIEV